MQPRLIDASGVLLVAIFAALLAAGCGLPSSYYLTPPATPTVFATPLTPLFSVKSTVDNSESELRGFALYYKCYLNTGDIESNFSESSFESTLRSAGFFPVCSEDDTSPSEHSLPLFPIDSADRGKDFTITVNFNSPDSGMYNALSSYTRPDTTIVVSKGVRRYVPTDPVGSCKTFDFSEFLTADIDFSGIAGGVPSNGPFYIAMYALSYGLQDISTPIWSWPVYLGYVGIHN